MPTAFICHATSDKPIARKIARELGRHGVSVWLDEHAIRVGASLFEAIQQGLEQADFVIVALSKQSLTRPWVKRELRAALTLEVERDADVILPVLLDRVSVPLFLRDKKYADMSSGFERGMRELLAAVWTSPLSGVPMELETTRCIVEIDLLRRDGSLASYAKTQTIRARASTLTSYREAWSADGKVGDFSVSPGTIGNVWTEAGTLHVDTIFPKPLKRGKSFTRVFRCVWRNSFTDTEEYWDQRQHHPSRNIAIVVRFPKTRPPVSWSVQEREGAMLRSSRETARRLMVRGKPALRLHVRTPKLFHSYILRWSW